MFGPLTSEKLGVLVSAEAMETAVWKYWLFKRGRRRRCCSLHQPSRLQRATGVDGAPLWASEEHAEGTNTDGLRRWGTLDKGNLQNRKANMESK